MENKITDFNKNAFWGTIAMILLIFFGTWILSALIKPIIISLILTIVIMVIKYKTIFSGIKYYWKKLMGLIFKNGK